WGCGGCYALQCGPSPASRDRACTTPTLSSRIDCATTRRRRNESQALPCAPRGRNRQEGGTSVVLLAPAEKPSLTTFALAHTLRQLAIAGLALPLADRLQRDLTPLRHGVELTALGF